MNAVFLSRKNEDEKKKYFFVGRKKKFHNVIKTKSQTFWFYFSPLNFKSLSHTIHICNAKWFWVWLKICLCRLKSLLNFCCATFKFAAWIWCVCPLQMRTYFLFLCCFVFSFFIFPLWLAWRRFFFFFLNINSLLSFSICWCFSCCCCFRELCLKIFVRCWKIEGAEWRSMALYWCTSVNVFVRVCMRIWIFDILLMAGCH